MGELGRVRDVKMRADLVREIGDALGTITKLCAGIHA